MGSGLGAKGQRLPEGETERDGELESESEGKVGALRQLGRSTGEPGEGTEMKAPASLATPDLCPRNT